MNSTQFWFSKQKAILLQWHQETLVIQNEQITKDSFAWNLRNSLDELKKLVEENVLFWHFPSVPLAFHASFTTQWTMVMT